MASDDYWAGFFDGEGTVGVYEFLNHPGLFSYRLGFTQKHPAPIDGLIERFGGTRHWNKTSKVWQWTLGSAKGRECAKALLPYLTLKSRQMRLFLFATQLAATSRSGSKKRRPLFTRALRLLAHEIKTEKHGED